VPTIRKEVLNIVRFSLCRSEVAAHLVGPVVHVDIKKLVAS
jgi:hypothetical protein